MGHDVSTIGIHKLNVTSIEALASDLSKRFKANVEYGYNDQFSFDNDGIEIESSYDNIVIGMIKHPEANQTLWLCDENYQIQQIIDKCGNNDAELSRYIRNDYLKAEFDDAKRGVCFDFRDIKNDISIGTIFYDTFYNFLHFYYPRWWSFCGTFKNTDNIWPNNFEVVSQYRKEVMDLFFKIGGDKVVHLDDQGETQYLTYGYHNWQDILSELSTSFKDTTLNISEFMKHKKPLDDYLLAFYDDFSDLN
jgi:hypothetical protein